MMTTRTQPITNPVEKFFLSDRKSKVLAIKAMCAYCVGCEVGHREAGFIESVRACTAIACPLHSVRPYQRLSIKSSEVLATVEINNNYIVGGSND